MPGYQNHKTRNAFPVTGYTSLFLRTAPLFAGMNRCMISNQALLKNFSTTPTMKILKSILDGNFKIEP